MATGGRRGAGMIHLELFERPKTLNFANPSEELAFRAASRKCLIGREFGRSLAFACGRKNLPALNSRARMPEGAGAELPETAPAVVQNHRSTETSSAGAEAMC